jgi:SAM-dependent methyltransferase
MRPYALAMQAYHQGDHAAELLIRRDDGYEDRVPIAFFFREPDAFGHVENFALDRCTGHVLDVGAGSGLHSVVLQERGVQVTALDVASEAVGIMRERGVADAVTGDVMTHTGGPYDTLIMLGHGIGVVEDLEGLDAFLAHVRSIVAPQGRVLVHSVDVRDTEDPVHLTYHARNREAGRYEGETRLQFGFGDDVGPSCGWLHVDPETLAARATAAGWNTQIVVQPGGGEYLAELSLADGAS